MKMKNKELFDEGRRPGLARVRQLEVTGPAALATEEWVRLRTRLLEALEAYPEARKAVLGALEVEA